MRKLLLEHEFSAEWIWSAGGEDVIFARKTFELPAVFQAAPAFCTCDNQYILYVNGQRVGADLDPAGWMGIEYYDIRPFLGEGTNAIAMEARNTGGPAGLMFEAVVSLPGGDSATIKTDASWLVSGQRVEGWQAPEFDASQWSAPSHWQFRGWEFGGPLTYLQPETISPAHYVNRLRMHGGVPTLFFDDQPDPSLLLIAGWNRPLDTALSEAGVHIFSADQGIGTWGWWDGTFEGQTGLDGYIGSAVLINPDAHFLLRVGLQAPQWWKEQQPDDCVHYQGQVNYAHATYASENWRRDAARQFRAYLRHIHESHYADRVMGLLIAAGEAGEWGIGPDTSEPTLAAFRAWLREKYGDVASLRRAWHDPAADFATAVPPPPGSRPDSFDFRDGVTLEAWIYPRDVTGNRGIVARYLNQPIYNLAWILRIDSGLITFHIMPAEGRGMQVVASNQPLEPNRWYHVMGAYDAASGLMRLFIDGKEDNRKNVHDLGCRGLNSTDDFVTIGSSWGAVEPFDGLIDEVRVSDTARPEPDLGRLEADAHTAALLHFDEGTGVPKDEGPRHHATEFSGAPRLTSEGRFGGALELDGSAAYLRVDPWFEDRVMDFRLPGPAQREIDYYRFWSELTADTVAYFARIAKEEMGGNALVGAFYGQIMGVGSPNAAQWNGHSAVDKLLDCPDVDFLAAPCYYLERLAGGAEAKQAMADSLQLRGKMWFIEADDRTFLNSPGSEEGLRHKTAEESIEVFRRNSAFAMIEGMGMWWMSSVNDPRLIDCIGELQRIENFSTSTNRESASEVAVLVDVDSAFYLDLEAPALIPARYFNLFQLARMGAPYDIYNLDDLADPQMKDYKLYIFLDAFHLTAQERQAIDKKVKRNNSTALWLYAPGILDDEGAGPEKMRAATGIALDYDRSRAVLSCSLTDTSSPLTAGLPDGLTFGGESEAPPSGDWSTYSRLWTRSGPVVYSADPEATVLGEMTADGKPGFVVKSMPGWTSVFIGAPSVPAALLRQICRASGVHIYEDAGDWVDADADWLAVHTASEGERTIGLPERRDVYDVFERRVVGRGVSEFTISAPKGTTKLYFLGDPGAIEAALEQG